MKTFSLINNPIMIFVRLLNLLWWAKLDFVTRRRVRWEPACQYPWGPKYFLFSSIVFFQICFSTVQTWYEYRHIKMPTTNSHTVTLDSSIWTNISFWNIYFMENMLLSIDKFCTVLIVESQNSPKFKIKFLLQPKLSCKSWFTKVNLWIKCFKSLFFCNFWCVCKIWKSCHLMLCNLHCWTQTCLRAKYFEDT